MASSLLGSDKLKADLERISLEMEAAGEPAALAGAEALASAMRSAAPKDTGTLAASIRVVASEGGAAVGANVPYDRFVQKGTTYMDAQPYAERSITQSRIGIVAAFAEVFKRVIH